MVNKKILLVMFGILLLPIGVFATNLNDLHLYYQLEETGSPYADSTTNGYDASATAEPLVTVGKINYGQYFDGSNDFLDMNDWLEATQCGACSTTRMYSFWIKTTATTGTVTGSSEFSWSASDVNIRVTGAGKLEIYHKDLYSTTTSKTSTTSINDNNFHHVVVSLNGTGATRTTYKIYIDGIAEIDATESLRLSAMYHPQFIGALSTDRTTDQTSNHLAGTIDEWNVWSASANQTIVNTLYNNGDGISYLALSGGALIGNKVFSNIGYPDNVTGSISYQNDNVTYTFNDSLSSVSFGRLDILKDNLQEQVLLASYQLNSSEGVINYNISSFLASGSVIANGYIYDASRTYGAGELVLVESLVVEGLQAWKTAINEGEGAFLSFMILGTFMMFGLVVGNVIGLLTFTFAGVLLNSFLFWRVPNSFVGVVGAGLLIVLYMISKGRQIE